MLCYVMRPTSSSRWRNTTDPVTVYRLYTVQDDDPLWLYRRPELPPAQLATLHDPIWRVLELHCATLATQSREWKTTA